MPLIKAPRSGPGQAFVRAPALLRSDDAGAEGSASKRATAHVCAQGVWQLHWPLVQSEHFKETLARREMEAKRLEDAQRWGRGPGCAHDQAQHPLERRKWSTS